MRNDLTNHPTKRLKTRERQIVFHIATPIIVHNVRVANENRRLGIFLFCFHEPWRWFLLVKLNTTHFEGSKLTQSRPGYSLPLSHLLVYRLGARESVTRLALVMTNLAILLGYSTSADLLKLEYVMYIYCCSLIIIHCWYYVSIQNAAKHALIQYE